MEEAKALKVELEKRQLRVFLCSVPEGESLADAIIGALHAGCLVVILGTATYGQKTASPFSTYQELTYIIDKKKPMFLVKMCKEFLEPYAQFHLPSTISFYRWLPATLAERQTVPTDLVDRVMARFLQVRQEDGELADAATPGAKAEIHGAY